MRRFTEADRATIWQMHEAGVPVKRITNHLGRRNSDTTRWLRGLVPKLRVIRWSPCIDEVSDDLEVREVVGEQWDLLDHGGCSDRQVDLTLSGVAAPLNDRCRQLSPNPSNLDAHRKRIEGRFHRGEPVGAACALVVVGRDEKAKVEFGDRNDADRRLDVFRRSFAGDEYGSVEKCPYEGNGSTIPASKRARSSTRPAGASPVHARASPAPLTQRRWCAGPSSATGRPATVTVSVSPASTRRSTSLTWLRSSF